MKMNVILKTVAAILFTALLSVGNMVGQTSVSKLTPAQLAARQAQLEQNIQLIMPPPISPAMLAKIQVKKSALALAHRMGGGLSPMDSQQQQLPSIYGVIDLETLGGNQSYAYGINNKGTVVGYSYIDGYNRHAFQWDGNPTDPMQDIGSVTSGITFSLANGINDNGQIIGDGSVSSDNRMHALMYSNGSVIDLAPGTFYNCYASSINASGQVAGYCQPRVGPPPES